MAWPSLAARTKDWGTEILTDSDLEGQLDLIITYINDMMSSTTGHKHDATTAEGPKILINDLTIASRAQGDTYYDNGTNPTRLAKGTALQLYRMNSGATAPEWASYSGYVTAANALAGSVVQVVTTETAAVVTCATTGTTWDDTIPAITDGVQILSRTITPNHASNLLYFFVTGNAACNSGANHTLHLHKDGAAAIATTAFYIGNHSQEFSLMHSEAAGSTSSQTWTVRLNPSSGGNTSYVNGDTAGTRLFGGVATTKIVIIEVKV